MTTLAYRIVHVHDLAEGRDTTVLLAYREYSTGGRSVILHQIEGTYHNEEEFQTFWDNYRSGPLEVEYFTEMSLGEARVLARKLQDLIDEVDLEEAKA